MELTEAMDRALTRWAAQGTWNTSHQFDMRRWYDFVAATSAGPGSISDERWLKEEILRRLAAHHGFFNNDYAREVVATRVGLAINILDYLNYTGQR